MAKQRKRRDGYVPAQDQNSDEPKVKRGRGRQRGDGSKYTKERANAICARLGDGEPLTKIVRDVGIGLTTIYDWRDANKDFAEKYARARARGEESISHGWAEISRGGQGSTGDVARDKLVIETDHRLLRAWNPLRWGDKVAHMHGGDPNNQTPIQATLVELVLAPVRRIAVDDPATG